jgi:integrase
VLEPDGPLDQGGVVGHGISSRRRNAALPPRVVDELARLPHRNGEVFRTATGIPYTDHDRRSGGQFKTAWAGAIRRSGLDPSYTPHTLRHTWASWHYALNKDPIRLKQEGGWSNLKLVERYAHLMPAGFDAVISEFLCSTTVRPPIFSVFEYRVNR